MRIKFKNCRQEALMTMAEEDDEMTVKEEGSAGEYYCKKKKKKKPMCFVCGKLFHSSFKTLYHHMKHHSHREWRQNPLPPPLNIHHHNIEVDYSPPPRWRSTGKRGRPAVDEEIEAPQQAVRGGGGGGGSSSQDNKGKAVIEQEEEEIEAPDVRGTWKKMDTGGLNIPENNTVDNMMMMMFDDDDDDIQQGRPVVKIDSSKIIKTTTTTVVDLELRLSLNYIPPPYNYKCSICSKCFASHQALGGHMTSHSNLATNKPPRSDSIDGGAGGMGMKRYECNKCGKTFATGQALGGHKTIHRIKTPPQSTHSQSQSEVTSLSLTPHADGGGHDPVPFDFDFDHPLPIKIEEDEDALQLN